jgi:hypothetical protein
MTVKNDVIGVAQAALAFSGMAVNVALLAVFAWGMTTLFGVSAEAFSNAGGIPPLSTTEIQSAVLDPNAPTRAANYTVAWFAAVGAAGCTFMTALGARWAYHALSRGIVLLKD